MPTEEQWKESVQESIKKSYDAYLSASTLLNKFITDALSGQLMKYGIDRHDEAKQPFIDSMKTLRTAFKHKLIEYLLCMHPEWMADVADVDWNYSDGLDIFACDVDGNYIDKDYITLEFI